MPAEKTALFMVVSSQKRRSITENSTRYPAVRSSAQRPKGNPPPLLVQALEKIVRVFPDIGKSIRGTSKHWKNPIQIFRCLESQKTNRDQVMGATEPDVKNFIDRLEKSGALNAVRAAEEAQRKIRYLRPEFQCPQEQGNLNVDEASSLVPDGRRASAKPTRQDASSTKKQPWPKSLPDQVRQLRAALATSPSPVTAEEFARTFSRARTDRVADLLETLTNLGQARQLDDGRYTSG
jgi:hypothetical protein